MVTHRHAGKPTHRHTDCFCLHKVRSVALSFARVMCVMCVMCVVRVVRVVRVVCVTLMCACAFVCMRVRVALSLGYAHASISLLATTRKASMRRARVSSSALLLISDS